MKKVTAIVLLVMFLFVSGVLFAGDKGSMCGSGKGDSAFEKMKCCVQSLGKPCAEKVEAVKETAPELTAEELKKKRECTGVGMRGIIGNE